jgi:hypothetical protein
MEKMPRCYRLAIALIDKDYITSLTRGIQPRERDASEGR